MTTKTKKPVRKPRTIEVVEDAPVSTKSKAMAEPKAKATKTKPATADVAPAPVEHRVTQSEQNGTVAKSGAKDSKKRAVAATRKGRAKVTKDGNLTIVENEPATVETIGGVVAVQTPSKAKAAIVKRKSEPAKRLSALDAAAQILTGTAPMTSKELIEAMASKSLWTSPGGKTPHATLYAAILREISAKGNESRFVKTERGKFAKR